MKNKTVVITGATSGIGEVAAIRLAERGARIVFTARDKIRALVAGGVEGLTPERVNLTLVSVTP